jgi:hypothetical protein
MGSETISALLLELLAALLAINFQLARSAS